jgi:preprotein translocase subunit SecY
MEFPVIISTLAGYKGTGIWSEVLRYLSSSYWCNPGQIKYTLGLVVYVALLIFFAYFYTSITFNPLEIADNLKKRGGFIPGIRPGKPTSDYITRVLNRITLIGALFLGIIAIVPLIVNICTGSQIGSLAFGGSSLLIVVGVILETVREIEAQMTMRHYKGFLE